MVKAGLDPVRVETYTADGIPDVQYIDGWIELKYAANWPRFGGVFRIGHYTQQQKIWGLRRWHAGGLAFLLLNVQNDWLLFDGWTAFHFLGKINRAELEKLALVNYSGPSKNILKNLHPFLKENLNEMSTNQKCRWLRVRSMIKLEQISEKLNCSNEEIIAAELGNHPKCLARLTRYFNQ